MRLSTYAPQLSARQVGQNERASFELNNEAALDNVELHDEPALDGLAVMKKCFRDGYRKRGPKIAGAVPSVMVRIRVIKSARIPPSEVRFASFMPGYPEEGGWVYFDCIESGR